MESWLRSETGWWLVIWKDRAASIMPNVSSFQPPPSPTAHHTVTTTSATATTMDTDNDNDDNDNDNDNEEQQQQWCPTHDATTNLLMWHAYDLTECAMSTATFRMTTMKTSMTPGPHNEGQGPPPPSSTNNNDCPPTTTNNFPAPPTQHTNNNSPQAPIAHHHHHHSQQQVTPPPQCWVPTTSPSLNNHGRQAPCSPTSHHPHGKECPPPPPLNHNVEPHTTASIWWTRPHTLPMNGSEGPSTTNDKQRWQHMMTRTCKWEDGRWGPRTHALQWGLSKGQPPKHPVESTSPIGVMGVDTCNPKMVVTLI